MPVPARQSVIVFFFFYYVPARSVRTYPGTAKRRSDYMILSSEFISFYKTDYDRVLLHYFIVFRAFRALSLRMIFYYCYYFF